MLGSQQILTDSKQLYHLKLDGGRCELAKPAADLSPYIDYYWLLTIDQPRLLLEVIPDTAIDLVMSPDLADFGALYFPVTKPFGIELQGPVHYTGVCFRSASVSQLLGLEFNELQQLKFGSDTVQGLDIGTLVTDIQHVTSLSTLCKTYNDFWKTQLKRVDHSTNPRGRIDHEEMIRVLEATIGSGSIATICDALGVSERQFRRLSIDLFGVSPKKLQNILRLQKALSALFQCEAGQVQDLYYDDSHRIKELKRLTGCTPNQIRQMAEKYNTR